MREELLKKMVLLLFLTFITGVCPLTQVNVKMGDMVALQCGPCEHNDSVTLWRTETDPTTVLYSNMSAEQQEQLGVIVYQNILVILSTSMGRQGKYSCSQLRSNISQPQFLLRVYSAQSEEYEQKCTYSATCYTKEACELFCPEVNSPAAVIPRLTSTGTRWHKEDREVSGYFASVEKENGGTYRCTRSYVYSDQTYNSSFTVKLDVQTSASGETYGISSPQDGQVFQVELDSTVVIVCKAVIDSCFNSLFWLSEDQFVTDEKNNRVFYNFSCNDTRKRMEASLVFKNVLEEDLSKNFTCKFQGDQLVAFATIILTKTARPSCIIMVVCTVLIVVVMVVSAVIYVKFKVDVVLFFRDSLGCQSRTSDGKIYDVFLMSYKSDSDGGLNEDDRRWLEKSLEECFGYKLCLFDRDVFPGQAVAEAVLDSVEQSRAVVLVPCCPDPGPGTGLLSAIHAALVERQTRLVFIDTKQKDESRSGSLSEALQLLSEAGHCVIWRGRSPSSSSSSSSFWKQLRYHLPAPQCARKQMNQLLPQTSSDVHLL